MQRNHPLSPGEKDISWGKNRYTENPGKKRVGNEMPWGIKALKSLHTFW